MTTTSFHRQMQANTKYRLLLWTCNKRDILYTYSSILPKRSYTYNSPPISKPSSPPCFPFLRSFNFCFALSFSFSLRFSFSTSLSSLSFFFLSFSFSPSFSLPSFSLDFSRFSFFDGNLKAFVFLDFEGLLRVKLHANSSNKVICIRRAKQVQLSYILPNIKHNSVIVAQMHNLFDASLRIHN